MMHVCSMSVAIGVVSAALLVYAAIMVSRHNPDNFYAQEWPAAVRRRNQYIFLLAIASVGVLFAAGRLGYINLKRFGVRKEGHFDQYMGEDRDPVPVDKMGRPSIHHLKHGTGRQEHWVE